MFTGPKRSDLKTMLDNLGNDNDPSATAEQSQHRVNNNNAEVEEGECANK